MKLGQLHTLPESREYFNSAHIHIAGAIGGKSTQPDLHSENMAIEFVVLLHAARPPARPPPS